MHMLRHEHVTEKEESMRLSGPVELARQNCHRVGKSQTGRPHEATERHEPCGPEVVKVVESCHRGCRSVQLTHGPPRRMGYPANVVDQARLLAVTSLHLSGSARALYFIRNDVLEEESFKMRAVLPRSFECPYDS